MVPRHYNPTQILMKNTGWTLAKNDTFFLNAKQIWKNEVCQLQRTTSIKLVRGNSGRPTAVAVDGYSRQGVFMRAISGNCDRRWYLF